MQNEMKKVASMNHLMSLLSDEGVIFHTEVSGRFYVFDKVRIMNSELSYLLTMIAGGFIRYQVKQEPVTGNLFE